MTDPFTSLRRAEPRTEPDPRFVASVLADVRRRLELPPDVEPEPSDHLIPTLEVLPMNTPRPKHHRWLLAAAACTVLIVGAVGVLLLRDGDSDAQPADSVSVTAADATNPPTTIAPTTVPPTTVPPLSDEEVAAAMLIDAADYAPDWVKTVEHRSRLDTTIAASIPACVAFLSSVFEAENDATNADAAFHHDVPTEAMMGQNVLVFAEEATAGAFYAGVTDASFPTCGIAYRAAGGPVLDACGFYANVDVTAPNCGAAVLGTIGDELSSSVYSGTWTHPLTGELHGPEEYYGAIMRVGRSVTLTGTLHMGDAGDTNVEVVTQEQLASALQTMADQAAAALALGAQP
jgi:hypothetical protein